EEKITQIEMSLDEALANVIEHAYSFDAYQEIQVNLWIYAHHLEIVIKDYGRSFDSESIPLPNLKKHIEERRIGGLGRYLIQTLMDEVAYRKGFHSNELRMIKRF
ncbi:ATP-binding protein, partial [bacterium]|nr:ATP-binding protein [bacterium]